MFHALASPIATKRVNSACAGVKHNDGTTHFISRSHGSGGVCPGLWWRFRARKCSVLQRFMCVLAVMRPTVKMYKCTNTCVSTCVFVLYSVVPAAPLVVRPFHCTTAHLSAMHCRLANPDSKVTNIDAHNRADDPMTHLRSTTIEHRNGNRTGCNAYCGG